MVKVFSISPSFWDAMFSGAMLVSGRIETGDDWELRHVQAADELERERRELAAYLTHEMLWLWFICGLQLGKGKIGPCLG